MESLIKKLKGPIVVIGANGFIGSRLVHHLTAVRADVIGVYRTSEYPLKAATYFNVSYAPNAVINKYMTALSNGQVFIHAGSSAEYGDNCDAPSEDASSGVLTEYGKLKLSATKLIQSYALDKKKAACILRLYSVYGYGEPEEKLIPRLRMAVRSSRWCPLGNPNATYDFIHVDDVCRAFILAALNLKPKDYCGIFNIGTGVATSLEKLVDIMGTKYGCTATPQWNTYAGGLYYDKPWRALNYKAQAELGWVPSIKLEDAA